MRITDAFRLGFLEWIWEEVVPSGGSEPSGNRGGALFSRDGTGKFVLVGGRQNTGVDRTDYWSFDMGGTNQWTQVVASGLTNVAIPSGYADGSGNIFVSPSTPQWDQFVASTVLSEITVSGGTQTALTDSGSGTTTETPGQMTVDIPNKRLWSGRVGSFNYYSGYALTAAVQDGTANTNTKTAYTSSNVGRVMASSFGYYPSGNALYMLTAPSTAAWTLSTSCVYKYDITAGTGWAAETGVTNNAGSVGMPAWPYGANQMIWSATENKFFIFVTAGSSGACARVLTYDPATKTLAEVLFTGSSPGYIMGAYDVYQQGRGNAGTVVESSGTFYFCTCWGDTGVTNARIWKLRRV